jgi:hypothetical protein
MLPLWFALQGKDIVLSAQTERRGSAGPVSNSPDAQGITGRFVCDGEWFVPTSPFAL